MLFRKINSFVYYLKFYLNQIKTTLLQFFIFCRVYLVHKVLLSKRKVALGTIFSTKGGVANHILALKQYLKTTTITVPHNPLLPSLNMNTYWQWCDRYRLISNPVLHSHADTWFIQYCQKQQRNYKAKWVHTYHSYYNKECFGELTNWQLEMNKALFYIANNASVRISVSKWLQAFLVKNYGISTIYIPNAIDFYKCQLADKQRFTQKYKLKDFILFTSGYSYVKNPLEFVRLAAVMPDEEFVMIGSGITTKTLKEDYGELPQNFNIIAGYLRHDILLDAVAASKVFVMTSRFEGLPTALMEAMALGKPVVASNVYGCKELLDHEKFGYLYELGNTEDLKNKTKLALCDKDIGLKAQKHIKQNYDWKVVAPQIDEIYKSY